MKGSKILLTGSPSGYFLEGTISGALKPGVAVTVKATALVNDEPVFEAWNATANGKPQLVGVLLEDRLQGKTATDAYVDGTRCFVYCPLAGDQLNMLFKNLAGTADDVAIGDLFMLEDGSGKLLAESSSVVAPFVSLEVYTDPTADKLIRVLCTGH